MRAQRSRARSISKPINSPEPSAYFQGVRAFRADPGLDPKWGGHGQARWLLHGKGTGVLIGADCVLSAAHILWREESGEPRRVDRVVVIPARDGKTKPLGSVEAADWRTPAGWDPGRQQRRWDFAVIRLKDAIGNKSFKALGERQLGWWGSASLGEGTTLKPLKADWLNGRRVISTGYPGDKCGTRSLVDQAAIDRCVRHEPELWASTQWWAEGKVSAVHPARGLLHHTIDTHEGQSGSPVWYYWRDEKQGQSRRWLVGLHVAPGTLQVDAQGNQRRVDNMAVWISSDVLDEIARLRAATGAVAREAEAGV